MLDKKQDAFEESKMINRLPWARFSSASFSIASLRACKEAFKHVREREREIDLDPSRTFDVQLFLV